MQLDVRNVSVGYPTASEPVQRFVNFTVNPGEICCVLGSNGCGKSTLFKSLLGIQPLLDGEVRIDGRVIKDEISVDDTEGIGYVAQALRPPFSYTVLDVVLTGRLGKTGAFGQPTAHDYLLAEQALEDMGVYALRDEVHTNISGGELQLVMIARALCRQPQLLILDEPTAALDYGNVVRVIKKVKELVRERNIAVVMATHSPDHAFLCNSNVLLMQKERPSRFGRAVDVITEKNMREAYGVNVKIVEFVSSEGEIMRMCAPSFGSEYIAH